ncbi:MAG: hypothetical protein RSC68_23850 [Acinetobacter sp.]
MKQHIILLACVATCPFSVYAQSSATSNTTTVTVQKIEGYGESGDAFTFKASSGKRFMVFNAGGTNPIKGEALIQQAVKSKQKICLKLDRNLNEPRMVLAVKAGACQ